MCTKIAQISYGNINPSEHIQIERWQIYARVAKQYNKA
jgi:hypothetical protein